MRNAAQEVDIACTVTNSGSVQANLGQTGAIVRILSNAASLTA